MTPAVPEQTGFRIDYPTVRELATDHDSYIVHGGLLVPCADEAMPATNTTTLIRIQTPLGKSFDLAARVVHQIAGQGFMVTFEDAAQAARTELKNFIGSEEAIAQKAREPKVE